MDKRDVKAERLTHSTILQRLERDYEEAPRSAVFTAECGFFSATRLQRLLTLPFPAPVEGPGSLAKSSNDHWARSRVGASPLAKWLSFPWRLEST
jgi:hypothetical protein